MEDLKPGVAQSTTSLESNDTSLGLDCGQSVSALESSRGALGHVIAATGLGFQCVYALNGL